MKMLVATLAVFLCFAADIRTQETANPTQAWSRSTAMPQNTGSPVERGAAVFNNWCGACHSKDVRNAPGTVSLQFKYQGKVAAALEDRQDLTAQSLKFFVRQGVATMPFYRKTEISDADLEALVAYLSRAIR
jgi:cytochrome c5